MQNIELEFRDRLYHIAEEEYLSHMEQNAGCLKEIQVYLSEDKKEDNLLKDRYEDSLGWSNIDEWAGEEAVSHIMQIADKVRKDADIFVLIGVGGSNQAARAVVNALQTDKKIKIMYAGNNISAHYVNKLIEELEGKSVYINLIAKNFETLEPGIGFRLLRNFLEKHYGENAKNRITVTGTKGSTLYQLAMDQGYDFLLFPDNIGGRYSALSDVGLFPMAVAGMDIRSMVQGAKDMRARLLEENSASNLALQYATYRNLLLQKGYNIEMMSFFEPQLLYFTKWWIQLFAESEGKQGKGIFPVAANYSEDLHSIGQYVQDGQRILFETFMDIKEQNSSIILDKPYEDDYFGYLDGKDFWDINKVAYEATIDTHSKSGIPCLKFSIPKLSEYYFGQMFYLFEFSCYLSGSILGVNPFDQPGVENYKEEMFSKLGKF